MKRKHIALKISLLVVLLYPLQLIVPNLTEMLALRSDLFLQRPWTLITSMFIHSPSDPMHLLNNLFFLAIFGAILELHVGAREFSRIFFGTGIAANITAFTLYQGSSVLGASGAISGIVAALAIYRPRQVGLFWGAPMPMWAMLIGWILTNMLGLGAHTNTAYAAHIVGLAAGAVAGIRLRKVYPVENDTSEPDLPEISEQRIREWEEKHLK
jgi:membrane associated rhomboid family serine protease